MSQRGFAMAAISVAACVFPWAAGATAEVPQQPPTSIVIQVSPSDTKQVEGTVVDMEPRGPMVTMLRLDSGTELLVPASAKGPGGEVRIGASVSAQYVETEHGKIATFVRGSEIQAP